MTIGYVERVEGDNIQIRIHHHEDVYIGYNGYNTVSVPRDWDELQWERYDTYALCGRVARQYAPGFH